MARSRVCFLSRYAVFVACAFLTSLTGCGEVDSYPAELKYPVRGDLLVTNLPKEIPTRFNNPGRLPLDTLAALPMRFDASRRSRVIDYSKVEQLAKDGSIKLDDNDKALLETSRANILDPRNLTSAERNRIGELLTKLFGTPASPKVAEATEKEPLGVAKEVIERLKLDAETLKEGSRLYRHHCLHCHGLEGNGRGPTGFWVNPHPRDYRQGVFKFTSSTQDLGERKPRRDDLMHILVHGIEGSSMPSFGTYPRQEVLDKIISYVIHLSLRGEVEMEVIKNCLNGSEKLVELPNAEEIEALRKSLQAEGKSADEIKKTMEEVAALKAPNTGEEKASLDAIDRTFGEAVGGFAGRWLTAQESAIIPDAYPYPDTEEAMLASAARGAALFMQAGDASCVSCHKNFGREAPYSFDQWGTIVRPRDLVNGYYRGGRRPIDMYYRVHSGISGAGMASYDKLLRPNDDDKAKKIDKIWDLVNFMQALHYPDMRAKLKDKHGITIE